MRSRCCSGANGAGKTTLLRILAGLTRAEDGTTHIAGRPMHRRGNRARRLVGFAGHQTMLYSDLTCRENLEFYGRLYGIEHAGRRIEQVLEQIEPVGPGEPQGAHAVSRDAETAVDGAGDTARTGGRWLLDEPESGLDAESVATLGDLLRDWGCVGSHRAADDAQRGGGPGVGGPDADAGRRAHRAGWDGGETRIRRVQGDTMSLSDLPSELGERGHMVARCGVRDRGWASAWRSCRFGKGPISGCTAALRLQPRTCTWLFVLPLAGVIEGARKMFEKASEIRAAQRRRR